MGRTIQVAPSILSADFAYLAQEIERVERGGANLLHLDVMDGRFVPNITIGPPVISAVRRVTRLPLDAHLMIAEPSRYVDNVARAGANWISVHVEADLHLHRTIHHIKDLGVKAGVALNPATPLGTLEEILPEVDFVLVMSVNPGFGGQHFIASSLQKIRNLRAIVAANGYGAQIEVDGGIGPENLAQVIDAGAEVIVSGSAIFGSSDSAAVVREMRGIADRHASLLETV